MDDNGRQQGRAVQPIDVHAHDVAVLVGQGPGEVHRKSRPRPSGEAPVPNPCPPLTMHGNSLFNQRGIRCRPLPFVAAS